MSQNTQCLVTSLSFLADPRNYANVMHTIGAVEIPVHSFVAYIILQKTPRQMNTVNILMTPLFLYPELASISLGFWSKIGMSAELEMSIMITLFAMVGVSLSGIYENRYFVLASPFKFWHHLRYVLLFLNHFFALLLFYPIISGIPNQQSARIEIYDKLPCPPSKMYQDRTLVLASDWKSSALFAVPFAVSIILQIAIFLSMSICILRRALDERKMSSSTLRMQRKFLLSVIVQTSIPFCVLLAPMIFNCYTIGWRIQMQGLTNIGLVFMTLHGLSSSLAILFIHKPYRDATFGIFQKNIHTSVVSSSRS